MLLCSCVTDAVLCCAVLWLAFWCCCHAEKLLWKNATLSGFFLLRYADLWR